MRIKKKNEQIQYFRIFIYKKRIVLGHDIKTYHASDITSYFIKQMPFYHPVSPNQICEQKHILTA